MSGVERDTVPPGTPRPVSLIPNRHQRRTVRPAVLLIPV